MTIFTGDENDYQTGAVILINKDIGQTSFGAVKKVRYLLLKKYNYKKLKVGHAGTLDPLADGLLILCTGKETKNADKLQLGKKEYIAKIMFGATTPSFDRETETDQIYPVDHITTTMIENVLKKFTGEIQQVPPQYSAVHVNGERAYRRVRKGESFVITPRTVTIENISIIDNNFPEIMLKITCSKGTYIRSLAFDIGKALDSGAYLSGLTRTKVGNYCVENATTTREMEKNILNL